jgi:hypothetical protein
VAKYLISFPSAAMVVPDGDWEAVGWEGGDATPAPGQSPVEILLIPDGDGTLLRLRHQGQRIACLLR